jgi:hypothetical protein
VFTERYALSHIKQIHFVCEGLNLLTRELVMQSRLYSPALGAVSCNNWGWPEIPLPSRTGNYFSGLQFQEAHSVLFLFAFHYAFHTNVHWRRIACCTPVWASLNEYSTLLRKGFCYAPLHLMWEGGR